MIFTSRAELCGGIGNVPIMNRTAQWAAVIACTAGIGLSAFALTGTAHAAARAPQAGCAERLIAYMDAEDAADGYSTDSDPEVRKYTKVVREAQGRINYWAKLDAKKRQGTALTSVEERHLTKLAADSPRLLDERNAGSRGLLKAQQAADEKKQRLLKEKSTARESLKSCLTNQNKSSAT